MFVNINSLIVFKLSDVMLINKFQIWLLNF